MEPLLGEIDALREVLFTPVESFVSDKERAEKGDEWAEKMAHKRMFSQGIKAVDAARGSRTLYMVVLRFGQGSSTFYTGYGPYATKGQAEKAVTAMSSTFEYTAAAVVPMRNAEGLAGLLSELDAKPALAGDWAIVADDARAFRNGWNGKQATRSKYLNV